MGMTLHDALVDIRAKKKAGFSFGGLDRVGICTLVHFEYAIKKSATQMKKLWVDWPKYSGEIDYPVPSPDPIDNAQSIFWGWKNKWTGEYGQLRYELLDYLIERTKP